MASAFSHQFEGESGTLDIVCGLPVESLPEFCTAFSQSPKNWFTFAPDSSIHAVPGLQSQALDDAAVRFLWVTRWVHRMPSFMNSISTEMKRLPLLLSTNSMHRFSFMQALPM